MERSENILDDNGVSNPLVSIIIVTFNSGQYVLETLESAKAQTYKNIELIITDDGSRDNTVEICKNWLEYNKERFIRTELIVSPYNTGIASNGNRGLAKARGEWIKGLAGDDILLENCIEDFVGFVKNTPDSNIVFGKIKILRKDKIEEVDKIPKLFKVPKEKQYDIVYKNPGLFAPASFINRNLLDKVGGFDERYNFLDDKPLWIKIADEGEYFYFLNKFVVLYRIHSTSIIGGGDNFINEKYYASKRKFLLEVIIPFYKKRFDIYVRYFLFLIILLLMML